MYVAELQCGNGLELGFEKHSGSTSFIQPVVTIAYGAFISPDGLQTCVVVHIYVYGNIVRKDILVHFYGLVIVQYLNRVYGRSRYVRCRDVVFSAEQIQTVYVKVLDILAQIFYLSRFFHVYAWKFLQRIFQCIVTLCDV